MHLCKCSYCEYLYSFPLNDALQTCYLFESFHHHITLLWQRVLCHLSLKMAFHLQIYTFLTLNSFFTWDISTLYSFFLTFSWMKIICFQLWNCDLFLPQLTFQNVIKKCLVSSFFSSLLDLFHEAIDFSSPFNVLKTLHLWFSPLLEISRLQIKATSSVKVFF